MSKGKRFGELIRQIPVRLADLVIKLVSVKGVALGMIAWALATEKIDGWMFLLAIGAVLGIRSLEKVRSVMPSLPDNPTQGIQG